MPESAVILAGVIGVMALAFASVMFYLNRRRYARWSAARGIVLELIPTESASQDGEVWHARVEFQTAEGRTVRFTTRSASNPPVAPKGGKVAVLYNPAAPDEAVVNNFFHRHILEIFAAFTGVVGLIIFFAMRK